eukprot:TRINITY_DN56565_c0_g1_i1.p2 TRINITY_DN56565_c0_g1~~TRINITY_DN56565_c0_g1_i1.p2  ORF type:complete len:108 (-),score=10.27 TRINITY_DN56565_c0_g1_i1:221-544(-)
MIVVGVIPTTNAGNSSWEPLEMNAHVMNSLTAENATTKRVVFGAQTVTNVSKTLLLANAIILLILVVVQLSSRATDAKKLKVANGVLVVLRSTQFVLLTMADVQTVG